MPPPPEPKLTRREVGLAVLSGLVASTAFPMLFPALGKEELLPGGWTEALLWVALVPLLGALDRATPRKAALLGLIAGMARWLDGRVKVVGVEPEGSRALHAALEIGKIKSVHGHHKPLFVLARPTDGPAGRAQRARHRHQGATTVTRPSPSRCARSKSRSHAARSL